jgi:hypothetical protein
MEQIRWRRRRKFEAMQQVNTDMKLAYRISKQRPANPAPLPRWLMIAFVLLVAPILWLGVLADSSGHLTTPGMDSILYLTVVIGVAGLLAYADRK